MRPTTPPDYPDDAIAEPVQHGRGALSNESSRFDSEKRIRTTDGWESEATAAGEDELPPLRRYFDVAPAMNAAGWYQPTPTVMPTSLTSRGTR